MLLVIMVAFGYFNSEICPFDCFYACFLFPKLCLFDEFFLNTLVCDVTQ